MRGPRSLVAASPSSEDRGTGCMEGKSVCWGGGRGVMPRRGQTGEWRCTDVSLFGILNVISRTPPSFLAGPGFGRRVLGEGGLGARPPVRAMRVSSDRNWAIIASSDSSSDSSSTCARRLRHCQHRTGRVTSKKAFFLCSRPTAGGRQPSFHPAFQCWTRGMRSRWGR